MFHRYRIKHTASDQSRLLLRILWLSVIQEVPDEQNHHFCKCFLKRWDFLLYPWETQNKTKASNRRVKTNHMRKNKLIARFTGETLPFIMTHLSVICKYIWLQTYVRIICNLIAHGYCEYDEYDNKDWFDRVIVCWCKFANSKSIRVHFWAYSIIHMHCWCIYFW